MGWRYLLSTVLILLVSGCGYHLRGAVPLPEVMAKTHLIVPDGSPLRYEMESLLLSAGGEVVEEESGATAVLRVVSASIRSRTLSVDALGRASEYALSLTVKYSLSSADGGVLAEKQSSHVERDFRFDPDNVLAKGAEQEMVQQEMYRVAAQQMLRRLRTLSSTAETAPVMESAPAQ